jgi:putative tricarboxylic transport membrane protein
MTRRDRWSAVGLALVATAYLVFGRAYSLDTLAALGPGAFPLAVGLVLLALAVWQFAAAGRRIAPSGPPTAPPRSRASLVMAGVLVVYAAVLPRIGFLVASSALVFVSARLMGLDGWWRPVVLAVGVSVAARVLFVTWLGVPLP